MNRQPLQLTSGSNEGGLEKRFQNTEHRQQIEVERLL